MSIWDNVKKFAQPYSDDEYDDYDDYEEEFEEEVEEEPVRRAPRRAPVRAPVLPARPLPSVSLSRWKRKRSLRMITRPSSIPFPRLLLPHPWPLPHL
jgi:hypothetical protein